MLARLIELCLRYRAVVVMAAAVLVAVGWVSFLHLPFDAFPDTTPVQVQVNTQAPALSPLEVERQISYPLEQAIAGLPGLQEVRSLSKFGFSQVVVVFEDDFDIYRARQLVAEKIDTTSLPDGVSRPSLGPMSTGLGEVFQYLVKSDALSAAELRTLHHWVIRPQMVQEPGVAEINTWGGWQQQFHVLVDPAKLVKFNLTLDEVARALAAGNRNVGAGRMDVAGEAQPVQGQGLMRGLDDLKALVVAQMDGVPINLSDVARVKQGYEIRRGAVTAYGQGEVVLGLGFMLMGQNSRELTKRLEERLAEVSKNLPDTVELQPVYSRSDLVQQVLNTVRENLLVGALLVIAVLFFLMGNLRAGLIVALAIPLSMLFAFNAMLRFGIAGSLMSLGALDFGLVVDSSVIMVENAARRVNLEQGQKPVLEIVRDAALEVRRPTLFGELIIAIVYLPVLALEGVEGKLFQPMALTVIFALAGSMILSVTLMPVLASLVLGKYKQRQDNRFMRGLKRGYGWLLEQALAHKAWVLGVAVFLVLNAAFLATRLGTQFVPKLQEQAITINTVRIAGISLDESIRLGTQLERLLLEEFPDEIQHIWSRTGTAEVATDPMGLELTDIFITLTPREQWTRGDTQQDLVVEMSSMLDEVPGMRAVFTQPIEMRINEMVAGIRADVGVKLFGDDFETLRDKADEIRRVMQTIPGAADVNVEQLTGQAMVVIEVDRQAAGRLGLPAGEILDIIASLGTRKVGEVVSGQRRFDLVLGLVDEVKTDMERLRRMLIHVGDGRQVPLSAVAKIEVVDGPASINREWAKRRIIIQANVRGRDVGGFVGELRQRLEHQIDLPEGYHTDLGGQFEHMERAQQRLLWVVPIALLLVFSLLFITYGRAADALRVFTGVPFGAVGGIGMLWLSDIPFSISAGVGFVALSGVAVLGDMVLVSRVKQLQKRGYDALSAIRRAATTRLRPVLMTSLVAIFGFIPMALNTGVGAEVQKPLATVVIGGMVTATIATLFVLPVLYLSFGGGRKTR
jgi:cobalt-zinc-cadmium resistance protein CzcA